MEHLEILGGDQVPTVAERLSASLGHLAEALEGLETPTTGREVKGFHQFSWDFMGFMGVSDWKKGGTSPFRAWVWAS